MMVKLGFKILIYHGLKFFKISKCFDDVIFNSILSCHNRHFDVSRQL